MLAITCSSHRFAFVNTICFVPVFLQRFSFADGISSGANSVYSDEYLRSIEDPEEFWGEVGANMVHWDKPFEKVMDNSNPPFTKWYVGGYLNACYNAIDRHVLAGKGSKVAIIHDSPLTKTIRKVTYQELYDTVNFEFEFSIKFRGNNVIFPFEIISYFFICHVFARACVCALRFHCWRLVCVSLALRKAIVSLFICLWYRKQSWQCLRLCESVLYIQLFLEVMRNHFLFMCCLALMHCLWTEYKRRLKNIESKLK